MSKSLMMGMIKDQGTRRQFLDACQYEARGNVQAIQDIYRKVVGN